MLKNKLMFLYALVAVFAVSVGHTAGGVSVDKQKWSFSNIRADWDKDEIYRGYTVATQICMGCHSFKYIAHRNLAGAGFTEAEIKALATELDMHVNDVLLAGLDDETAQEMYGKTVPDLTLMNKARDGGADYVYGVLTGYVDSDTPEGIKAIGKAFPFGGGSVPEGSYYNAVFPGHAIAMAPPLASDDLVEYHDGTPATAQQMAKDVVTFMQWTAEPERVSRHKIGIYVLLYLLIFIVLAYFTKRAIWRDVH